jgi:hypothetical protein
MLYLSLSKAHFLLFQRLVTVAPIEQKLTVLANDEVFLATKEKVNSGVEEEKKNS